MPMRFGDWLSRVEKATQPSYIIAEVGVNHNGDLDSAHLLIDVAADAGANSAKFQVFHSDLVAARTAPTAEYQLRTTDHESQLEMIRKLELPDSAWRELRDHCVKRGIDFIATAFDAESLQLVEDLSPPVHKVPSGEITNSAFLRQVAEFGRPVILSTGMSSTSEVLTALATLGAHAPVVLMHCISAYPTLWTDANLLSIPHLMSTTGRPVGWSDHTIGGKSALMALALGSRIFEKHITLDRASEGPDHSASADPDDFAQYVADIRDGQAALGLREKWLTHIEKPTVGLVRRSWHARRNLAVGTVITEDDVIALRPESGVSTTEEVVGRLVSRAVAAGDPIRSEDLVQ